MAEGIQHDKPTTKPHSQNEGGIFGRLNGLKPHIDDDRFISKNEDTDGDKKYAREVLQKLLIRHLRSKKKG